MARNRRGVQRAAAALRRTRSGTGSRRLLPPADNNAWKLALNAVDDRQHLKPIAAAKPQHHEFPIVARLNLCPFSMATVLTH